MRRLCRWMPSNHLSQCWRCYAVCSPAGRRRRRKVGPAHLPDARWLFAQVNPDEIWRIRATSTDDEPKSAIVIDYGWDRVYVKESLANVVEKVGGGRPLKKFTLPGGGPVYIVLAKVTGVTRAIPQVSHPNAHATIVVA